MAQIFYSHSARDDGSNRFFHKAFSLEGVKQFSFEFEHFQPPATPWLQEAIRASNALFVVLGPNAAGLAHTRGWINWECGVAAGFGRDIWVFEPNPPVHDIVVPQFRHYMVFEDTQGMLDYVRATIRSYADEAIVPAVMAGGALGAGIGYDRGQTDDRGGAALMGALAGGALSAYLVRRSIASQRPQGTTVRCPNERCQMTFQMHTEIAEFPCPTCRQRMAVQWQAAVAGA